MDNDRINKLFEVKRSDPDTAAPDERVDAAPSSLFGGQRTARPRAEGLDAIQRSFIATPRVEEVRAEPKSRYGTKSIFDLAPEPNQDPLQEYQRQLNDELNSQHSPQIMAGELVRDYRIKSMLGEGGMGEVYLAEHSLLGHEVAVKLLLPQYSADQQYVKRFFLEANVVKSIKHPSIVEVYDFGYHTNGSAFIVMEYLNGVSLEQRFPAGHNTTIAEALRIVREVARGLIAAHDRDVIHRDLKPDNIFLIPHERDANDYQVKILDFGLAKVATAGMNMMNTRQGSLLGTPAYMSPEQCRGTGDIDFRTDIYSLGCVLFRLLTGRPPFVAETPADVLACHLREPAPSLRDFDSSISLELSALVMCTLAKDPNDRFATLEEFANSIEALEQSYGAPRLQRRPTNPGRLTPSTPIPALESGPVRAQAAQAVQAAAPAPRVVAPAPMPMAPAEPEEAAQPDEEPIQAVAYKPAPASSQPNTTMIVAALAIVIILGLIGIIFGLTQ